MWKLLFAYARLLLLMATAAEGALISGGILGPFPMAVDTSNGITIITQTALPQNSINSIPDPQPRVIPRNVQNITIGGLFNLLNGTTGVAQIAGVQETQALICAIQEFNANPNLLPDTRVFYNIQNTFGLPSQTIGKAIFLTQLGALGIVGGDVSEGTTNAADFLANNLIPFISPNIASTALDLPTFASFTRTISSYNTLFKGMTLFLQKMGWNLISLMIQPEVFGSYNFISFTQATSDQGIIITCESTFSLGDGPLNLTGTINCLKNSDARVMVLLTNADNARKIISGIYAVPELSGMYFFGYDQNSGSMNTILFPNGTFPGELLKGSLGMRYNLGDQSALQACMDQFNPTNVNYTAFRLAWQQGLRCSLSSNVEFQCPDTIEQRPTIPENGIECRCTGKEKFSDIPVIGQTTYTRDAAYAIVNAINTILHDCQSLKSKDFCSGPTFTSEDVVMAIQEIEFVGLTGNVKFEQRNRVQTYYEFVQYREDGSVAVVGTFDTYDVAIDFDMLQFKGQGVPQSTVIPTTYTVDNEVIAILVVIACAIGIVFCLILMAFFYRNRNTKTIRQSSPKFVLLMLLGIILVFASTIVWSVEYVQWTCCTKVWLAAVGFGLIMGCLLAKTYRIFKIFTNTEVNQHVITDRDLFMFTGLVVLIEILLCCVWTFVDGIPGPVVVESTTQSLYSYVICQTNDQGFQTAMIITILVFNGFLVFCGVGVAYLTRNVDLDYNESRYIAFTMYSYLLLGIVIIPIYFTVGDSSGNVFRQYLTRSLAALIAMYFTIIVLFLPKVGQAKRHEARQSTSPRSTDRALSGSSALASIHEDSQSSETSKGGSSGSSHIRQTSEPQNDMVL